MRRYLQGRLHVSWLVAWGSTGVLAGIAASSVVNMPIVASQLIIVALALTVMAFLRLARYAALLVLLAGLLFGLARGGIMQQALTQYEPWYGKYVTLSGKVSEDTVSGPNGDQRIQLVSVEVEGRAVPGKVWVSSGTQLPIKRSDMVTFQGLLGEGFGNLPASMFRARLISVERSVHGDVAREVRDWFAEGVRVAIAEPEASLGIGFLVGQRSTLPEELDNQLKLLGLTHIVVASGYNLTILVRFTRRGLAKHSKYLATMAAGCMICAFVLVTGFSPSMSRAALVTGLSLLAWYFGRRAHPLVILSFSAAITAIINPAFVWGDIGWYLSFTAFAGVMILAPLLKRYFWGEKQPRAVTQIIVETFSAQLTTLPIIALVFGQYSLLALPANALILPLVPLAMLLTFFAGLAGVILPIIAPLIGWPASFVLGYMTTVVDKLAAVPGAANEVTFSVLAMPLSYLLLIGLCIILWRKTGYNFRSESIVD